MGRGLMLRHLPNILTMSRIFMIPIVVAIFYLPGDFWVWVNVVLFTLAGLTDYVDGWLARKWNYTSAIGKFLDPIADKLMVAVVLVMLVAEGRMPGILTICAIIVLSREILVSGLREYLGPENVQVPVSKLAKWKTFIQMLSMGFLIAGDVGDAIIPYDMAWEIGQYGFGAATILTVITGWSYLGVGLRYMIEKDRELHAKKETS